MTRLFALLSLLQTPREWPGSELARRLEVSPRTIRRDVERLRDLGYPVEASRGAEGGYRLGAGAAMPPLLLDDEEAVAIAVGLRTAAAHAVEGIDEASVRALAKLEHVLPSRLRHRVATMAAAMVAVPGTGPTVSTDVLTAIATAARDRQRLRFDYVDHAGTVTRRDTEPHRLVHTGRRWYLLAWDADRDDWRTYRVDRITPKIPTGPRFTPREPPDPDVAAYVTRGVGSAMWEARAHVRLHAPADVVRQRLTPAVGTITAVDDERCDLQTGSDSLPMLAAYLGFIGVDFEVLDPPELVEHVRGLGERYLRAAGVTA